MVYARYFLTEDIALPGVLVKLGLKLFIKREFHFVFTRAGKQSPAFTVKPFLKFGCNKDGIRYLPHYSDGYVVTTKPSFEVCVVLSDPIRVGQISFKLFVDIFHRELMSFTYCF